MKIHYQEQLEEKKNVTLNMLYFLNWLSHLWAQLQSPESKCYQESLQEIWLYIQIQMKRKMWSLISNSEWF